MLIAIVAMIGMLSGLGAAVTTDVVYNGDGQYDCNYNGYGTGYIGIHTYTSDGSDHLMTGWTNSEAHGCQTMNAYGGTAYGTNYSGTVIDRSATVGGAAMYGDEAGFIWTVTTDGNNNSVISYANYHDNVGAGSHVTTDQTVVVGSLVNIGGSTYNVTGVAAATNIHGFAYGSNTTVSGLVRTQSGDEYTYALLAMENGKMNLYTLSAAGSVEPAFCDVDGACGQWVEVDAKGVGVFAAGAGTDMHGAGFYMVDDDGHLYYYSHGTDVTMDMTAPFDGNFDATGYVYAVDLS